MNTYKHFYKWGCFDLNKISHLNQCIYIIYGVDGTCLYVGESACNFKRKYNRINQQMGRIGTKAEIGRVEVLPFREYKTKKERMYFERLFINLLQPLYNKANCKEDTFDKIIKVERELLR